MKNKRSLFIAVIILLVSFLAACTFFTYGDFSKKNMSSLFSWKEYVIYDENVNNLDNVIDTLSIGRLFQCFEKATFKTDNIKEFLDFLDKKDVDVYYLTGQPEWGIEGGANEMIKEIDFVYNWNKSSRKKRRLSGIVFDVEPYTMDNWSEDEMFLTYIENMKTAYKYANEKNLTVIICIPYWYNTSDQTSLELLIRDCCDEIAVMNYNKENEFENIKDELDIAKKYKKGISSIFEFIEPGKHSLEEINTYYNDGINAAQDAFDDLSAKCDYKNFYKSYHYFEPILEILNR